MRLVLFVLLLSNCLTFGQSSRGYILEDVEVIGNKRYDSDAIIIKTGLVLGKVIYVPGPALGLAVQNLWKEGIFKDVSITNEIKGNEIFLQIHVQEHPLIRSVSYKGLSSSEERSIREMTVKAKVYSGQNLMLIKNGIEAFLKDKGYISSNVVVRADSLTNDGYVLIAEVDRGIRRRIDKLEVEDSPIGTRGIYKPARRQIGFIPGSVYSGVNEDWYSNLEQRIEEEGYLDASIEGPSITDKGGKVDVSMNVEAGDVYQFGKIEIKGNTVFSTETILNWIEEKCSGHYAKSKVNEALYYAENYSDLSSRYYELGYGQMAVHVAPAFRPGERLVDLEVHVQEGKKMDFGSISVQGNVRTKDHVILREILTKPGDQFSRSKVISSQKRLSQLGYFIPEEMDIKYDLDTAQGLVHLTYVVKERITDKFLISGGYDGIRLVGSLGLEFQNFSASDLFKKGSRWNPLPAGGGQQLSAKVQSDGHGYTGVSFSFAEPWVFGKPFGMSLMTNYGQFNSGDTSRLYMTSVALTGFHRPFKGHPFLNISYDLNYKKYDTENWSFLGLSSGNYNSFSGKIGFTENTTNDMFFPTEGIILKGSLESSLPPLSRFSEEEAVSLTSAEKYRWFEYHKTKLSFKHYYTLDERKKTVLNTYFGLGVLGNYNSSIGDVPFGRFSMGGTGLTNYNLTTSEFIGLRGYEPEDISSSDGDPVALKYGVELRRNLLRTQSMGLSGHLFFEGGNTYTSFSSTNLYDTYKSAGVGIRVLAPVVGMIGADLGWGISGGNVNFKEPKLQITLGVNIGDF